MTTSSKLFKCIVCNNDADGYIEDVHQGWRDGKPFMIYLCSCHYDDIYKKLEYEWHEL
jgi:hypothetical protein